MMVILGLGSNLGDRLANFRQALHALKQVADLTIEQISPVYLSDALLPENAPPDWDMPHLNLAIRCRTQLSPLALLQVVKEVEWSIGRKPLKRHWGPRILDIDILAWEDKVLVSDALTVPHKSLLDRPFALWPLADVAPNWVYPLQGAAHGKTAAEIVEKWGSRFDQRAPFRTHQLNQRIDMPQLVGVLNVTPDSFSDGGQFSGVDQALNHVLALVCDGAEIIDIGAESTAPHANAIDIETEWTRLEPILSGLKNSSLDFPIKPKISLDTRHAEIAKRALAAGMVDWINDVAGLDDVKMREVVAEENVPCVIMHHLSLPERRDHILPRNSDPVQLVYDWGAKRLNELEQAGIKRDNIIFDPGIGFGKVADQSMRILQHIAAFEKLGARLLVGHSRKTFLSLLTGLPFAERDIETMAMALMLAKQPIDYLRVHNVAYCARGFKAMAALTTD